MCVAIVVVVALRRLIYSWSIWTKKLKAHQSEALKLVYGSVRNETSLWWPLFVCLWFPSGSFTRSTRCRLAFIFEFDDYFVFYKTSIFPRQLKPTTYSNWIEMSKPSGSWSYSISKRTITETNSAWWRAAGNNGVNITDIYGWRRVADCFQFKRRLDSGRVNFVTGVRSLVKSISWSLAISFRSWMPWCVRDFSLLSFFS